MGWSSGSELVHVIETVLKPILDNADSALVRAAGDQIVAQMRDMDADSLGECSGFIGDADNRARFRDAPPNPKKGDTYKARWGPVVFDGRRWNYVED